MIILLVDINVNMEKIIFGPAEVKSVATLRTVRTVITDIGKTSENRLFVMYSIDFTGARSIVRLINGSRVGQDVSYVVSETSLEQLPIANVTAETKSHYEIVYDEQLAKTQTMFQLFVGNMYASTPDMTQFFYDADSTLQGLSEALKRNPKAEHVYMIKYMYGKEPVYTPFIGC